MCVCADDDKWVFWKGPADERFLGGRFLLEAVFTGPWRSKNRNKVSFRRGSASREMRERIERQGQERKEREGKEREGKGRKT